MGFSQERLRATLQYFLYTSVRLVVSNSCLDGLLVFKTALHATKIKGFSQKQLSSEIRTLWNRLARGYLIHLLGKTRMFISHGKT